jgi:hypothetical protein
MKPRLVVLSACVSAIVAFQGLARSAEPADAQWAELEQLMRGPKTAPKSQDEAREMMKANITEFDAKAAAFRQANPTDPRRWKLTVQDVQRNSMRAMVQLPAKSDEEIAKLCAEVIAAPDADKGTKAAASFYRVANAQGKDEEFIRLAEAHLKEYPGFAANARIEAALKEKTKERENKSK